MKTRRELQKEFCETYLGITASPWHLPQSIRRRIQAVTHLIIDTGQLSDDSLVFDHAWSLDGELAEVKDSARRALVGTASPRMMHLRSALGDVDPQPHEPVSHDEGRLTSSVWHHGEVYQSYWLGDPERILQIADLTEAEREAILMKVRKASRDGQLVYATGRAMAAELPHTPHSYRRTQKLVSIGLLYFTPQLYPDTTQAVRKLQTYGITVIYASCDARHMVEAIAPLAGISSRQAIPIVSTHGGHLPLDQVYYAELSNAEIQRIFHYYPEGSVILARHPLPEFVELMDAVRK